jgi:catechol 2,3-dioxygenase-like lactoylglutathione lyase family enzyme
MLLGCSGRSMPRETRLIVVIGLFVAAALSSGAQTPLPRPRITGISHVAFRVTDLDPARRFYGDVLGLSERKPLSDGRVAYAIGHRQRVVLQPGLPAGEDERLSHVAFETPDAKGLAAYLISRGIDVLQPPDRCEDTAIRVTDPDGHVIEFVQVDWPADVAGARSDKAISSRLLHAGLTVRDEQAAHRFYRDTLGFSEIWRGGRTADVTQWVNMRVPEGTEYLEYMLTTTAPDRRQRGVFHHICLVVPEMQAAWETVVRRTAPSARPALGTPNVGTNGKWQLNLYDPDGTRAELMEPFTTR